MTPAKRFQSQLKIVIFFSKSDNREFSLKQKKTKKQTNKKKRTYLLIYCIIIRKYDKLTCRTTSITDEHVLWNYFIEIY